MASEFGFQLGPIWTTENLVRDIEQDDRLLRPDVTYLSGQLDADRARTDQQDPIRLRQCPMRLADLLLGVVGVDQVRLGREGIPRTGGQDDVVGEDLLA